MTKILEAKVSSFAGAIDFKFNNSARLKRIMILMAQSFLTQCLTKKQPVYCLAGALSREISFDFQQASTFPKRADLFSFHLK